MCFPCSPGARSRVRRQLGLLRGGSDAPSAPGVSVADSNGNATVRDEPVRLRSGRTPDRPRPALRPGRPPGRTARLDNADCWAGGPTTASCAAPDGQPAPSNVYPRPQLTPQLDADGNPTGFCIDERRDPGLRGVRRSPGTRRSPDGRARQRASRPARPGERLASAKASHAKPSAEGLKHSTARSVGSGEEPGSERSRRGGCRGARRASAPGCRSVTASDSAGRPSVVSSASARWRRARPGPGVRRPAEPGRRRPPTGRRPGRSPWRSLTQQHGDDPTVAPSSSTTSPLEPAGAVRGAVDGVRLQVLLDDRRRCRPEARSPGAPADRPPGPRRRSPRGAGPTGVTTEPSRQHG